ncbi:MAG: ATP-dependent Clp protease proteolytic subunit [bacterium]|nr:ATP-dependent Clp protease proteolytic subunit [bacterium]
MHKFIGNLLLSILIGLVILSITIGSSHASGGSCPSFKAGSVILPKGTHMEGKTVYMLIRDMDFEKLRDDLVALDNYSYNTLVIDLYSYGGSLFNAMGMISLISKVQANGKIVEIRAKGIIASAGLLILLSGSEGHRFIDRYALVMFHELWSLKFFAIETPSSKEDEALVYRKIQNNVNSYITSRSKITREELELRIRNKEFWLTADEAVKYGFADRID